jgi:hypothetical protein
MRLALLLVLVLVLVSSVALADRRPMKPDAAAHFDRGRDLFMKGDFTQAMLEFERGRDLDPNPDFDYALGQVFVKLGDCKHAMLEYNAFLATHRSSEEVSYARESMALCMKTAREPAAELELPDPAPVPASPAAPAEPPAPAAAHPRAGDVERAVVNVAPWYADVPGGILAGAGIAGVAAGATYLVLADRDIAAANSATTVAQLQSQAAAGRLDRVLGTVGVVAGSALSIGAVVRYALVAHGHRQADRIVSIAVDRNAAFAVWSGRF